MSRARQIKRVLVAAALAALVSCSTVRVESDYNPEIDFSGLRSYAWMPDPPEVSADPLLHNSLLDGRIRSAVDRTLAGKGIRKVEVSQADFLVNYYVSLEQKIQVDTIPAATYGYGYGPYGGWHGGMASETRVRQYEEGTLILDVVDPEKDELLWRGSGTTRVSKKTSPEASKKKIDEVVSKLLEPFPPAPGK